MSKEIDEAIDWLLAIQIYDGKKEVSEIKTALRALKTIKYIQENSGLMMNGDEILNHFREAK